MRFKIILHRISGNQIPINYQYPLSSVIYRILAKGDAEYARFLHEEGYGKGYKFFTFSDLKLKFKLMNGNRMQLLDDKVEFFVHFHMPEASGNFIAGLFKAENITIADKKSKVDFKVQSVIAEENPWKNINAENEIIQTTFRPISAVLMGVKNEKNNYNYLKPDDLLYIKSLLHNWRGKIRDSYNESTAENAVLNAEVEYYKNPYRPRLVHIKQGTDGETQIKGYLNFKLKLTAEKRFIELIYNTGIGLENSQGMGCVEVIPEGENT